MFTVKKKKYWVFPRRPEIINTDKEEYDSIPVEVCKNCLSLRIIEEEGFPCYCKDCGSTEQIEMNIKELNELKNII